MTKEEKQYERMTKTKIPKLVTLLAVPTVISMLVTAIYNFGDTYFVSSLKNISATAAVGIVFSLMTIIQAIGFMIGMGAGSIISRLLGVHKQKEASSVAITALSSAFLVGVVIAIFGSIFINQLMDVLGASDTVLPYARSYAKYILLAAPIMSSAFVLNNVLRAEGKAKMSMIGLTTGGIINLLLDPLFLFTFDMGIAGAAIATAISQLISFLIMLYFFISKKTIISLNLKNISKAKEVYGRILITGLPSFCRQGLASIATILLNNYADIYGGDPGTAAMGVVTKIFQVIFMIVLGVGQGYQPVVGYNYSAKEYKRVKEAFLFMFFASTSIMVIGSVTIYCLAEPLVKIFTHDDILALQIGVNAIKWQCYGMPLVVVGVACNMSFQSIGKKTSAIVVSCMRQGIFYIPLIIWLPSIFGMDGVMMAPAFADILTCLASIPFAVLFFIELDRKIRCNIVQNEEKLV